ncbi:hypothetical protein BJ165DRAFT_643866 [Panaeolus papilionaceus]|nr:hypothetical protein BJ165DRAFT_643866 [Panaeolus papilionaceus]
MFALWGEEPNPKIVAYIYGDGPQRDRFRQRTLIRTAVQKFIPDSNPNVQHAVPFYQRDIPYTPASPHLINNITTSQAAILLETKMLVTDEAAIFFKEFLPTPTSDAFIIENYASDVDKEGEDDVKEMIQACFKGQMARYFPKLLIKDQVNDNLEGFRAAAEEDTPAALERAFYSIMDSVEVSGAMIPHHSGYD